MANLTREEKQDILLTLIDRMEDSIRDLKEIGRPEDAARFNELEGKIRDGKTQTALLKAWLWLKERQ